MSDSFSGRLLRWARYWPCQKEGEGDCRLSVEDGIAHMEELREMVHPFLELLWQCWFCKDMPLMSYRNVKQKENQQVSTCKMMWMRIRWRMKKPACNRNQQFIKPSRRSNIDMTPISLIRNKIQSLMKLCILSHKPLKKLLINLVVTFGGTTMKHGQSSQLWERTLVDNQDWIPMDWDGSTSAIELLKCEMMSLRMSWGQLLRYGRTTRCWRTCTCTTLYLSRQTIRHRPSHWSLNFQQVRMTMYVFGQFWLIQSKTDATSTGAQDILTVLHRQQR